MELLLLIIFAYGGEILAALGILALIGFIAEHFTIFMIIFIAISLLINGFSISEKMYSVFWGIIIDIAIHIVLALIFGPVSIGMLIAMIVVTFVIGLICWD